jgi:hypothetical protein
MDEQNKPRAAIFHQFNAIHSLMMTDRSMVELLKANEQMIRSVKTIDFQFGLMTTRRSTPLTGDSSLNKGIKSTSHQRVNGGSLDDHFSFENYLTERIK